MTSRTHSMAQSLRAKTTESMVSSLLKMNTQYVTATSDNRSSRFGFTCSDACSPMNFDLFVPHICMDWAVPQLVVVLRKRQDAYVSVTSKKKSPKLKQRRSSRDYTERDRSFDKSHVSASVATRNTEKSTISDTDRDNAVSILAYYDHRAQLVEVSIMKSPFIIHRQVMKAINYCLPFHNYLVKLNIGKGSLTKEILHELSRQLPNSNLTDICLEDSNVQNADYHILLDRISQLKNLSLRRCRIDDFECTEIAQRMDMGGPTNLLQTLDLTSNFITDTGAQSLGKMLRKNRQLLHLSLAGNVLTNKGATYILNALKEFPLEEEDVIERRSRLLKYMEERASVFKKCLSEVKARRQQNDYSTLSNFTIKDLRVSTSNVKAKLLKKSLGPDVNACEAEAQILTTEIVGEYKFVFDKNKIVIRDGYQYCTGNFKFCSLNLAYNNLNYESLKDILNVLEYQEMMKPVNGTGLMRLVVEGNNLPIYCLELEKIKLYLGKVICGRVGSLETSHQKKRISLNSRTSRRLK